MLIENVTHQLWIEQLPVGNISIVSFKLAHVANVLQFVCNEWSVRVSFAMDVDKNLVAVLPSVLASKPSRTRNNVNLRLLPIYHGTGRRSLTSLEG